jgi:uncharacterized protein (TIGR02594 family)
MVCYPRLCMDVTAYEIAERFIGIEEAEGMTAEPTILSMLRLDAQWVEDDETPWCSAFVNYVCWLLRLPRSKSLAARSWLSVGMAIKLSEARRGFDLVILSRGKEPQPGPEVQKAPGHVGFFSGLDHAHAVDDGGPKRLWLLGGNQSDTVCVAPFDGARVLGVRRLYGA